VRTFWAILLAAYEFRDVLLVLIVAAAFLLGLWAGH
jgi:hypothetical protein